MAKITDEYLPDWDGKGIKNNFIFTKFMDNHEVCREVLNILLPFEVGEIKRVEYEKTILPDLASKGIRFDVYAKDSNKAYNIEMQVNKETDLAKRVRYYQEKNLRRYYLVRYMSKL